jgi:hypothetical protein
MTVPTTFVENPYAPTEGTFRALGVSDMYAIVPHLPTTLVSEHKHVYDVGIPSKIESFWFSFQNRTITNILEVTLTLPPYLRVSLGERVGPFAAPPENPFVFHVPPQNDTITRPVLLDPPILVNNIEASFTSVARDAFDLLQTTTLNQDDQTFVGAGIGLINLLISFSETQAMSLDPGVISHNIIFDVFPLNVTGPVEVLVTLSEPTDLNEIEVDVEIPIDAEPVTGSVEPEGILEVPVPIEVEKIIPDDTLRWIDGTTGETKEGSPPAGWITEADGRAYPPFPEPDVCDKNGDGTGVGGIGEDPESENLSPLEKLVAEVNSVPGSFGIKTQRRGYIIDILPFITGVRVERIQRRTIQLLVADAHPDTRDFKIINWKKTFIGGDPVPDPTTDIRTQGFFTGVNQVVGFVKQGESPNILREAGLSVLVQEVKNVLEGGLFNIRTTIDDDDIQFARILGVSAAIVRELETNGAGIAVEQI